MLINNSILYSQTCVTDTINQQDKKNVISLSIENEKCDSVSKIKDNAIQGLKSTIIDYSLLLQNQKNQFDQLSDNSQFYNDRIDAISNKLIHSEKKNQLLKIGIFSVSIIAVFEFGYIGILSLKR